MKKCIALLFILFVVFLCIEITLRVIGYAPNSSSDEVIVTVKPSQMVGIDKELGWILNPGYFKFCVGDSVYAQSTHVTGGYRSAGNNTNPVVEENKKQIFLLGCSYTYGYSVYDTQTYAYCLQKKLPDYIILNYGVPAYSTVQMFLQLQRLVKGQRKPDIVILNYASFQNERSALGKAWARQIRPTEEEESMLSFEGIEYPYGKINALGKLEVEYCSEKDIPKNWPGRRYSAIIELINSSYDLWYDSKHAAEYDAVGLQCCLEIAKFCERNQIQFILYAINLQKNSSLKSANFDLGAPLVTSRVEVNKPEYNCGPIDPNHPSPAAHQLYAQEVYAAILNLPPLYQ